MSKGTDVQRAGRVQAAFTAGTESQATTSSYVPVEFEFGAYTVNELSLGHAVSLVVRATSTTQNSLIKVETKPHKDYSAWTELVAETTLVAGTDTSIYADVLREEVVRISIKESVAGGTVEVAFVAK